jgi:two-component sensor histidine kinase
VDFALVSANSAGIDVKKSDTLGLTLIRSLMEQIGGKLTVNSSHGTGACIVFQEKKP